MMLNMTMALGAMMVASVAMLRGQVLWDGAVTDYLELPTSWADWEEEEAPGGGYNALFAPEEGIAVHSATGWTNWNITADSEDTVTFALDTDMEYRGLNVFTINGGGDGSTPNLVLSGGKLAAGLYFHLGVSTDGNFMRVAGADAEIVADRASNWYVANTLVMGSGTSHGNRLEFRGGAKYASPDTTVFGNGVSCDNAVLVTGDGTTVVGGTARNSYSYDQSFLVGWTGTNNVLIVESNAVLSATHGVGIGIWEGAYGNTLIVRDGGALGGAVYVGGGDGNANKFIVSGTNTLVQCGNIAVRAGAGAYWACPWAGTGSDNVMEVLDGAVVKAGGPISVGGGAAGGSGNGILVSGEGSWLEMAVFYQVFAVGNGGDSSFLRVEDGGTARSAYQFNFGTGAATSNRIEVTGADSALTVAGNNQGTAFYVGGIDNELCVDKGGTVSSANGMVLGYDAAHRGNRVVAGKGGAFSVSGVWIGGAENELVVDGGAFNAVTTVVGSGDGVSGSRMWVKGDGKATLGGFVQIGTGEGADANVVRVEGEESVLQVAGVTLGQSNVCNRLEIAEGGTVLMRGGWQPATWIGRYGNTASSNNTLRIENGTLDVNAYAANGEYCAFNVASGGRFEIAGTNSTVFINYCLRMLESSVLRFELGKVAPVTQPILQAYGSGAYQVVWDDDIENWRIRNMPGFDSDKTAILEMDARAYACAGGGRVVLAEFPSGNNVIEFLDALVANVTWTSGQCGTVSTEWASDTGRWQIVAEIDSLAGTMILLR